jgi:hypothetical protein
VTDAELLIQCKQGLNIPVASTHFDGTINQKLLAIKSYMRGAGVSEAMLEDPLAISAIVMGVTDIWNLTGGDIKMSPAFNTLVGQLALRSVPPA